MKSKSLFRNIILNNLYEILLIITPLITTPYVSRILQPEGVGVYSFSISIVTYFTMVAALGTANYGMREIARRRDSKKDYSKIFWEIEVLTLISSAVCLLGWGILVYFYPDYRLYLIILSLCIFGTAFDIKWLFAGLERFKFTIAINSIVKIVSIIATFVFVNGPKDIWIYVLIYACSSFLGNLSMWIFLPGLLTKCHFDIRNLKTHLKETMIYFVPTIATTIYTVLDKTLIGIICSGNSENGYYEQATKIINMTKTISFAGINGVVTSRMSFLYGSNNDNKGKLMDSTFELNLGLSIGCMFGLIGIAHNFVPLFFGSGYDTTEYILYIFAPMVVVGCISNTLGGLYYNPAGKRGQSALYLIVGSVINLVLNIILIQYFNAIGAAISSIIAEVVISCLYLANCGHSYSFTKLLKSSWKKLLAGTIMCCFVLMLGILEINEYIRLAIQIMVGVGIYFILLFAMRDLFFSGFKEIFNSK